MKVVPSCSDVTCEDGANLSQGADGALPRVLANGDLHEEEGQAAEEKHDEVGDEEGAATRLGCKSFHGNEISEE